MVRAITPSVHVLSDPEHVNNYLEHDGAALSPASKDSLLSNAAVSGTNMKRSKKLQSVLTKMTTREGPERNHHQLNKGSKNKDRTNHLRRQERHDDTSRITGAFDNYESREDHGNRESLIIAADGDKTVGREQEEVRAAIRNSFFGSPSGNGTTPKGRDNAAQTKKKVYTSRSSKQVVSPRSRTRVSSPARKEHKAGNNARSSLSPVRGRRSRSSFSPRRRRSSESSSIDSNREALERPSTPIRTGRNPSPPTRRAPSGSNRNFSSNRSNQWSYDSLEESTDKTSSSDYDSSTTGSFSVDRMRSMRRKIQKASQKNGNVNERSLSPRRKISRPQPDEDDDDNGGILPLLDIAGAATDFVSHLMDQILPESPGADQPRPPHHHSDYDSFRPGYEDTDDYDENRQRRRRSPKRRDSPRARNSRSPRRRSSQKVTTVDEKKVSEVIKAAVNSSAYRDTDESVYSTSTEDGESFTYSVDETASTNMSSSLGKAKMTQTRQSEKKGEKLTTTETSGTVNGLVAKIEEETRIGKTGKSQHAKTDKEKLLNDFDEEKATPQNLAVALSMSGEESFVSDEDYSTVEQDSLRQHMAKLKRDDAVDPSLQRGKKSEEPGRDIRPKMPMLGKPVFPQGHIQELEAKIKESYDRRMKNAPASESTATSEGVSSSANRNRSIGNNSKPLIPPDAPVASKKVAVNYINAIAKYFQPPSEHAADYVKAISKGDNKTPTTNKNSVKTPMVTNRSPDQKEASSNLSGFGTGTKLEMDSLVSKIDGVVQKLIESGKLPSGNDSEGDDLQKRNTAELLKNLAILRSRRAINSVPHQIEQQHEKDDAKNVQSSNHENSKSSKESLEPKDDETTDITSSLKPKEDDTTVIKSSDTSRLAAIRAKRDEAALRIKEKTERLSDMHALKQEKVLVPSLMSFPTFCAPHSAQSVSSRSSSSVAETVRSSRSHGCPPRPEDANSPNPIEPGDLPRKIRQTSTFAHLSSTRSVDDSFSPPSPRRERTKSAASRRSKSVPRSSMAFPSSRPNPLSNHRSDRPNQALYRHQMIHRDETLRSTASDAALKDWESNEVNKLPLILNVSRTDGGSRDEYESPRNQMTSTQPKSLLLPNPYSSKRRPTYGRRVYADEDLTFGGDDGNNTDSDTSGSYTYDETGDTDSGSDHDYDTDGSESDGERLARIAEMVKELKKRQRLKSNPGHR